MNLDEKMQNLLDQINRYEQLKKQIDKKLETIYEEIRFIIEEWNK